MDSEIREAKMICCDAPCKSFGKHRNGLRRFRCRICGKTHTEPHTRPLDEMRLARHRAVRVLNMLLEGMSIRSCERLTGVHRDTILKLLVLAGQRCENVIARLIVNVSVKDVQCDEIWSFIAKK